jgi:nucleoside-diphosphate-sugar epimerase
MKFSKVLVTGGAGFIGSHIVDALIASDIQVGILDDLSTGEKKNLPPDASRVSIHQGDIRDEAFVTETVKGYDAIIHEAALVSVTRSVEDPHRTNSVNIDGTLNLLVAAKDANVRRFIYASSSSVYGETETLPKVETMITSPISPYAVSKLSAENYCRVFASVYGLPTVSLRYFNVFGPRQKYGPYSGVIPAFVRRVMSGKPPIIFGDGLQTRDFTFVQDVVSANLLSLQTAVTPGEVFNVSAGRQVSLNELAASVTKLMGRPDLGVEHAEPRKGDIWHSYADITKARLILGYAPRFSLEEGLDQVIGWFAKEGMPQAER